MSTNRKQRFIEWNNDNKADVEKNQILSENDQQKSSKETDAVHS